MHLFATLVGCFLGIALSLFLLAGAVAIRVRVKRARVTRAVADLLMIVDSSVWHFSARAEDGLTTAGSLALKADVLALVREMGASQIFELTQGLRLPPAMVEPMLSGLIEQASAKARRAPEAEAAPTVSTSEK